VPILLITRTIPLEAYDKHEHTSTEHQTAIAFEQNLKISRVPCRQASDAATSQPAHRQSAQRSEPGFDHPTQGSGLNPIRTAI
jgi:hypothetical protein